MQNRSISQYFRESIALAIPVVIGQVSGLLMNITDNIMIGHLGSTYLSASSLGNSCFVLVMILGFGAMNAIPALVSEARGAERHDDLRELYTASIWQSAIWGLAIGIGIFLFSFALPYMQQDPEEAALAALFMQWLALSAPFQIIFLGQKGYFDGMGRTNIGMMVSLAGLVLNILLNLVLIFGWWMFPPMGLVGAAIATGISRVMMVVVMHFAAHRNAVVSPYALAAPARPAARWMKQMFMLGLPMGLQIFFEVAAFSGAAIMAGWLGNATAARAAHQITINLVAITFMFSLGLSVAGSVQVGEALGRGNRTDMKTAGKSVLMSTIVFMTCSAVMLAIFRHYFAPMYGIKDDPEVLEITGRLILIGACFQVFDGLQCVGAGLLRGLQDTLIPTIITLVAYWILWMPLAYYLGFSRSLGIDGIWYADVIALGFAAIMLNWRFFVMVERQ